MADPIVVFDLDGTLVDTAADLVTSLNHTIAARKLAPVGLEDITFLVGHGARAMIERAFILRGATLAPDELPGLLDRFIAHYAAHMPGESRPYPGVVAALERLSAAGFALAVCTNKLESLALPLIERLDLARHFRAISGGDSFSVRKPDPRHITETILRAGGALDRALMVGDSVNDILAARNAGLPSIAVPFGYSDQPVASLGADLVIDGYDSLTADLVTRLIETKKARIA